MFNKMAKVPNSLEQQVDNALAAVKVAFDNLTKIKGQAVANKDRNTAQIEKLEADNQLLDGIQANIDSKLDVLKTLI